MKKILIFISLKICEILGAGAMIGITFLLMSLIPPELISKWMKLMKWWVSFLPESVSFWISILVIDLIMILVLIVIWIKKNWNWAEILREKYQ